ncbi:MAG: RNA polymerase sigma factor [Gemmatimonadales bacterium]
MTQRTDEELVASYRAGEEIAADELVRRHATSLGRYLYASGAPSADVEDLVQEAFFRAFKALDSWRGEASFRAWLFRIGANLNKDAFRRQRGRVVVPIDDVEVADAADPESEVGASEIEARLIAELARLPRLQREVFLLRAQQGLEYTSISAALGTTPGAARVHYHNAVKRLKEYVQ